MAIDSGTFRRRLLSALVLIPVALAATWLGAPWLTLLMAALSGGMAWEWARLIDRSGRDVSAVLAALLGFVAILVAGFVSAPLGILIDIAGATLIARSLRHRVPGLAAWSFVGLVWVVLPCVAFLWLRNIPHIGFVTVGWMLVLVWTIDTAAYAAGKTFGGPKLARRISPSKTWSGLLGGMFAAMIVGAVTGWLTAPGHWWQICVLSGALAVVEQGGDIAESYAKRHFGVKDSSTLIPGHGGLLDRLDGMLAVVAAVGLFSFATGVNILTWH
jgi:phosphatidate cytidylyltransferase